MQVDLPDGRVIRYLVDGRSRRIGKLVNDVPDKAHGPFPDNYDYLDPSKNGWRVDPISGKMTPKK